MNKNSFNYLFPTEIIIFSCLLARTKPSGENGHSLFFSAYGGEDSQSSSLNLTFADKYQLCLQFKESPKHIHLSISDEDCYGMWNIIIQKLESAADTKTR